VTNRLIEVNSVGDVTSNEPAEVGIVNVTVSKSPGADDIDLDNVTVQWVDNSGTYDIVSANADANSDGTFDVTEFKDADDSAPVLNSPDDRLTMTFDLGSNNYDNANEFGSSLTRGETATLSATTLSGATSEIRLSVPQSLSGTSAVSL
jgi:archaellin